jgi:hypothetical protein
VIVLTVPAWAQGRVQSVGNFAVVPVPVASQAQVPATTYDCSTVTDIPAIECQALVALYDSTNGAGWTNNAGWLTDNTPCVWSGVACDTGHVRSLWLVDNNLSGSIPPELGNLADLQVLNLTAA